jgi:hypothetical protein
VFYCSRFSIAATIAKSAAFAQLFIRTVFLLFLPRGGVFQPRR